MADKAKTTLYLNEEVNWEMRQEAAAVKKRFPTEFIIFLWEHYKKAKPAK